MTISLRLKNDLAQKLKRQARRCKVSQSDFIRDLLTKALGERDEATAWTAGEKYFGKLASGRDDLSINYKSRLKKKLHAKHRSY